MSARSTPSPLVARGLGLACLLFLAWRAGSSLLVNAQEFERSLGTPRDALRWSQAQRIELAVRKIEHQAKVERGYLGAILAALEQLPPRAQVWLLAPKEDRRRRGLVRLQYLWHPREVKPIEVLPRAVSVSGDAYLLAFDDSAGALPANLRVVHAGPDWKLLAP